MSKQLGIEVYEWKAGQRRPNLMGGDMLTMLESPPGGGPEVGDTVLLPGKEVGAPESLGVPYTVVERVHHWSSEAKGDRQEWLKMWINVRRIPFGRSTASPGSRRFLAI